MNLTIETADVPNFVASTEDNDSKCHSQTNDGIIIEDRVTQCDSVTIQAINKTAWWEFVILESRLKWTKNVVQYVFLLRGTKR